MEWLDRLGFDEAWIGEHHSAGFEIISSPELFIAAAAERTNLIRLGTGVVSLPYHNPLMAANRIIQLDHMTRGRVMFGVGPGLLPSDAIMLGIDPMTQRDRMVEALDVILRLFNGEIVTEKTDWYTLVRGPAAPAALHQALSGGRGGQRRHAVGRPARRQIRPRHALRRRDQPVGFDALDTNWQIACDIAAEHGRTMDPARLRLVGPMHIAETREQACENARYGFEHYLGLSQQQPAALHRARRARTRSNGSSRTATACVGTPGRRDRADRAAAGQAGRVRRLPAAGAQLGRLGGDQALLRALCPLCDAAFQPRQRPAHRLLRLVRRQPRRVQRHAPGRVAKRCSTSTRPSSAVRRAALRARPPRARPRGVVSCPIFVRVRH